MTMRRLAVALVVLVLLGGIAAAQPGTSLVLESGTATDDFEDGDLNEYNDSETNAGAYEISTERVHTGSYALKNFDDSFGSSTNNGELKSENTFSLATNESFNITVWANRNASTPESTEPGVATSSFGVDITDDTENIFLEVIEGDGTDDTTSTRVTGTMVDGTIENSTVMAVDTWTEFVVEVDRDTETITLFMDGVELGSAPVATGFADPTALHVRFRDDISLDQDGNFYGIWYDDLAIEGESTGELTLDIETFMAHGSTQDYEVRSGTTDVTDAATVTSSNTTLITVDETAHTLTAASNQLLSGTVTITAEYQGAVTTVDVFVGNKTLDNIGDLPPPTWLSATFGHPGGTEGATGTWPGAVQLQWLFVCLVVGAVVSWKSGHALLGVGVAEVMLAFGWAIAWVSDGVLIASIIFVVYAALAIGDVASGGMAEG